jgi:Domain of unknown function (DUF4372)
MAIQKHKAERHGCGFTCWGQFVAMRFGQLGQAQSLEKFVKGERQAKESNRSAKQVAGSSPVGSLFTTV